MWALLGEHPVPYVDQAEQNNAPKSSEKLVDVHSCSRQDRIDRIALNALQPITFQPVFSLQMSDAWLDRGPTFHPSPLCLRCPSSSSPVDMHGGCAVMVMASIAHVHMRLADLVADQALDLLHLCSQRVAVVGISIEALRADEPSTTTVHRDTHLVAELILLARLAFCDALHFRLMNQVNLVLVMPLFARI